MNFNKKISIVIIILLIIIAVVYSVVNKDSLDDDVSQDIVQEDVTINEDTTKEEVEIQNDIVDVEIDINPDGTCIYDPGSNFGYRYGPTMLINDDGSIDAWFSRPGNNGSMWDYICYRHRDVAGNWSDEEIVLKPTSGSLDSYSVCDPGVIYFDGYYYIGYTGTNSSDGLRNQIFVARSDKPNGTYEKWNGSFWGGDPMPIVKYEGDYWGVGEVSFVIDGNDPNEMYCYYSYKEYSEDSMRCSKVDVCEDWPSTIRYKCKSFAKDLEECSSDVVYLKDKNIYLAFSIGKRMSEKSRVLVHYSLNGKNFEYLDKYKDVIMPNAHNMGISKHLDGHIESNDDLYICYAYSTDNKWGRWKTYIQEIDVK